MKKREAYQKKKEDKMREQLEKNGKVDGRTLKRKRPPIMATSQNKVNYDGFETSKCGLFHHKAIHKISLPSSYAAECLWFQLIQGTETFFSAHITLQIRRLTLRNTHFH